jgi:hypothetical protein
MSYIYNLADTWGDGATTFTAIKMNVTDTASAAGSLLIDLQAGSASKFKVDKTGTTTINRNSAAVPTLGTTPTVYVVSADSVINDSNYVAAAQANRMIMVRVNGTVASPTALAINDTVGQINGGGYTGSGYVLNSARIQLRANEAWTASASGSRIEIITTPITTNSPANVATFYGGGVHIGNTPSDPGAGSISAQGTIRAASLAAISAGGSTATGLTSTSTANFGVFFGSGAPTLSAAKGSLYLRSDGTTTNDRAYINTDGGTTWTALITAA